MKNRMVSDQVWVDDYIVSLPRHEILLFLYLLTNDRVNLVGIYQLPDSYMKLSCKLSDAELKAAKDRFQKDGRIVFMTGWVRIVNYSKYNTYSGQKLEEAKNRQLEAVPSEIMKYSIDRVSIGYQYPIDRTNSNSSNNSSKEEGVGETKLAWLDDLSDSDAASIASKYDLTPKQVRDKAEQLANYCRSKGKIYRNYRAFLQGALRRDIDDGRIRTTKQLASPYRSPDPDPADDEAANLTDEQREANVQKYRAKVAHLLETRQLDNK